MGAHTARELASLEVALPSAARVSREIERQGMTAKSLCAEVAVSVYGAMEHGAEAATRAHMRALMAVGVAALAGCTPTFVGESNFPDSGVVCPSPLADAGRATLGGGPRAFPVGAAYQDALVFVEPDSGVPTSQLLRVSLYGRAVSCAEAKQRADAGPIELDRLVYAMIPNNFVSAVGEYGVRADGGTAEVFYAHLGSDGGPRLLQASSGTFRVTAHTDCSMSGNFDVVFAEQDGGGAEPMNGTFGAAYCR